MFRVGQKVVCVDDRAVDIYLPPGCTAECMDLDGLTANTVYTIRDVGVFFGLVVCRVEEIRRGFEPSIGEEAWFAAKRFRPIVERKTDISIFTEMLTPSPPSRKATLPNWHPDWRPADA